VQLPRLPGTLLLIAAVVASSSIHAAGFRDLNKNGRLDVYEDVAQPVEQRVADLLGRMTIAEKAGQMFISRAIVNEDASLTFIPGSGPKRHDVLDAIDARHMSHFNIWDIADPTRFAQWQNKLQQHAEEQTRLGIPITLASDPRHHFSTNIFAFGGPGFSQFPETLGLAAIGDIGLIRQFANIVREEYLAVGLRLALHPQVDLATEPRWPRINGGFGEDAELSATIARAYILAMQGERLSASSVATMTKHFPGGGPQNEGLDPHFAFQKGQVYAGGQFDYHLRPFEAAIEAGTAAIMPYYGVAIGQTSENVAMAFNRDVITGLLRERYGFEGVICSDWGVITDITIGDGVVWPARAWGVEHLSRKDRVKKALVAGIDQFGGEIATDLVVGLIESGEVPVARIDASVRRILRQKFELGLFDDPYINVSAVSGIVGRPENLSLAHVAQTRSMTLLKNVMVDSKPTLPLAGARMAVYLENVDAAAVSPYAIIAESPQEADVAIIRLKTPWYPVETDNPFAQGFHHGDLDFKGEEKDEILGLLKSLPTIVVIYLDRPAVIPDIAASSAALIAEYGASDKAVAEVIFGTARPEGRLPFELPGSMEAVRKQHADTPADSGAPIFRLGYGLSYD
jgi:beta-glucosidase